MPEEYNASQIRPLPGLQYLRKVLLRSIVIFIVFIIRDTCSHLGQLNLATLTTLQK